VVSQDLRRGGQAEVYYAKDLVLEREVALKVIPPTTELASAVWSDRLRKEARLIARLDDGSSSSIVQIYDYGWTEEEKGDGRWMHYAVLECVQGGSASR
jgi:serine/threonine protein kinase